MGTIKVDTVTGLADPNKVSLSSGATLQVDEIVNVSGDKDSGIDLSTNDNIKFNIAGSQKAMIDSGGKLGIGTNSPTSTLTVKAFEDSVNGGIRFESNDGSENATIDFNDSAALRFRTNGSDRFRIDSSGRLLLATTSAIASSNVVFHVNADGVASRAGTLLSETSFTDEVFHIHFRNGNGGVGGIKTDGSSTTYASSSDYRLKENIITDWDATTRLKQLKPSRFNFKTDKDTTLDGFLAHEVSSIVPEAITGEKDETQDLGTIRDKDGNVINENVLETQTKKDEGQTWTKTKTEIVYQGIDQSKLVPLLVKTIQELEARITELEKA